MKCPSCNKNITNLECVEQCYIDYDMYKDNDFDEMYRKVISREFICPKCKSVIFNKLKDAVKFITGDVK